MRQISPSRERTLLYNLESCQAERPSPVVLHLKCAWSSAVTPLPIVCPTHRAVPPYRWNVFIYDRKAAFSQHSAHLVEHEARVLRVMQHIAKQDSIETL